MGLSGKKLAFLEARGREMGYLELYWEMGMKLN